MPLISRVSLAFSLRAYGFGNAALHPSPRGASIAYTLRCMRNSSYCTNTINRGCGESSACVNPHRCSNGVATAHLGMFSWILSARSGAEWWVDIVRNFNTRLVGSRRLATGSPKFSWCPFPATNFVRLRGCRFFFFFLIRRAQPPKKTLIRPLEGSPRGPKTSASGTSTSLRRRR